MELQQVIEQLKQLAKQSPTKEICGVIDNNFDIHPITNVAKNASTCFIFSKREYFTLMKKFKEEGNKVLFIYHSHPSGYVTPSKADLDYTDRSGIPQIIVSTKNYSVVESA